MRQISLYEMKPVYVAGDSQNIIDISKKISEDSIVFEQIKKDYLSDKKKYKDEYLKAKINHLKNRYLYGWLILKKYFEDAIFRSIETWPDYNKIEMKNKGWMIPHQFINTRIHVSGVKDETTEDLYIKYFNKFFHELFEFDLGESDSRVNRYYRQAIANYKCSNYYSCAVSLFPIIESFHQFINKYNEEKFYRIKEHLISMLNKIDDVQQIFDTKIDYYIKLVEQLNDLIKNHYFNINNSRTKEPEIINRNRLMHGLFMREVSNKDCLQLFCVISNMIVIKTIIDANELMNEADNQIKRINDGIVKFKKISGDIDNHLENAEK